MCLINGVSARVSVVSGLELIELRIFRLSDFDVKKCLDLQQ